MFSYALHNQLFSRIFLLAWIKKSKVPGIQPNDDKNYHEIKSIVKMKFNQTVISIADIFQANLIVIKVLLAGVIVFHIKFPKDTKKRLSEFADLRIKSCKCFSLLSSSQFTHQFKILSK